MSDFVPNPFRPGAGRVPPELAGRGELLEAFTRMLQQVGASGEGERPWVLSGLRGVGKTVLLNEFVRRARDIGWVTVKVEASAAQPLAASLSRELAVALRRQASLSERAAAGLKQAFAALRNFRVRFDPDGAIGIEISTDVDASGIADSGDLAVDLQELLRTLAEGAGLLGIGVLLAVDELQEASVVNLSALNVALHNLGQEAFPPPIVFIGTGLPSLPAVLADATSYAERLYDYRTIGLLDAESTGAALSSPAAHNGVTWNREALRAVVRATGGYPYFVQACGKHVWDVRTGELIGMEDANIGIALARNEVDEGLYRSRLDRVTPKQRDLLRAMAVDGDGPSSITDLVARTGKRRTSDLSVSRSELIRAGHIYAPDRGYVAFTVPGMADYITRLADD
ncbi:ATP-binding protein [Cryobacterium tepidiphilum]|uniref:ATP-binding protein n=1 Tax=Cryobacterium tepidiphilum TaxID=2486026 RepID=A0A3M8LQZ1_9MICO|nr:ATP-binding protein [Cryobacterium tepidiphilum]RNE67289.1 ATP-binding protein [Cryobacterium tepidiphilum]